MKNLNKIFFTTYITFQNKKKKKKQRNKQRYWVKAKDRYCE